MATQGSDPTDATSNAVAPKGAEYSLEQLCDYARKYPSSAFPEKFEASLKTSGFETIMPGAYCLKSDDFNNYILIIGPEAAYPSSGPIQNQVGTHFLRVPVGTKEYSFGNTANLEKVVRGARGVDGANIAMGTTLGGASAGVMSILVAASNSYAGSGLEYFWPGMVVGGSIAAAVVGAFEKRSVASSRRSLNEYFSTFGVALSGEPYEFDVIAQALPRPDVAGTAGSSRPSDGVSPQVLRALPPQT